MNSAHSGITIYTLLITSYTRLECLAQNAVCDVFSQSSKNNQFDIKQTMSHNKEDSNIIAVSIALKIKKDA